MKIPLIIALINTFILSTLIKWRFFDWLEINKPLFLWWYPICFWCFSFQLACASTIVYGFTNHNLIELFYYPFIITPITFILLKLIGNEVN